MKPTFRLESAGSDITNAIKDRVLKIRVNDAAGQKSDTLDVTLDDRGYVMDVPNSKAALKIWLGYEETELTELGTYTIDEVEITENPAHLKIRGKAADSSPTFKETKTRAWHNRTIGTIVSTIAAEHGLTPSVHANYSEKIIDHIDQENESDAHFLTRLSKIYGATSKPANGFLVFLPESGGLSASGQVLSPAVIEKDEILTMKASIKDRGNYSAVISRYRNKETNSEHQVTASDSWSASSLSALFGISEETGPVFRDKKVYTSQDMAQEAAKSKLRSLQAGAITIDVSIRGRADIFAERPVTINDVRAPLAGTWITTSVTHDFGPSGFKTKIVCGSPPSEDATVTVEDGPTPATKASAESSEDDAESSEDSGSAEENTP